MKYRILHSTRYRYSEPATLCHNQMCLTPRETARQRPTGCTIEVSPSCTALRTWTDMFGNVATYGCIEAPHSELSIVARSEVSVSQGGPNVAECYPLSWEQVAQEVVRGNDLVETAPFLFDSPRIRRGEEIREYAHASFAPGREALEALMDLTQRIHADFHFDPGATTVDTPTNEILDRGRGVCQDFAHLEIACLRSFGLPARYVSGYLVTRPPPGGHRLQGADASHAWLACYLPGLGWLEVDPTNNKVPGLDYVTLAWGRDYSDVCPIRGVFLGGGPHTISVSVDVVPDDEDRTPPV